jgi:hypothetical protein
MGQGILGHLHHQAAISPLLIVQGVIDDLAQMVAGERPQLEYAAATDQRFVDLKIGVLCSSPNQNEGAVLHMGK